MNKLFNVAAAIALTAPITGAFAANDEDMAAKLERLERIVMEQNNRLEKQEAEIATLRGEGTEVRALVADLTLEQEELDGALDARIEDGLAALKDSASFGLNTNIDGLKFKNDARFRYQIVDDGASSDQEQLRLRLRLGATYMNKAQDWEFGLGFEVGSASDDSANTTYNSGTTFQSLSVFLDYAYAKHNMDAFTVTVGQFKNPLKTTNMLWDSDIRPIGIAAQFSDAGFFATAGLFNADDGDSSREDDSYLAALQVGFESEGEDAEYGVALGYLHGNASAGEELASLNNDDYDIQIVDLYGWFGTSAGDVDLGLFGHYAMNIGADGVSALGGTEQADDNDQSWSLGGSAKLGKVKAKYSYKHIESEGALHSINDSDFGDEVSSGAAAYEGTNVEGHSLGLSYSFNKNVSFGVTGLFSEQIEGSADADLYQFDLLYKF